MKNLLAGLAFSMFWASASIATKFGLRSSDPLILAFFRFMLTSLLLGAFCYVFPAMRRRYPLPETKDFVPLAVIGLLSTAVYLGSYIIALQYIPAGLAGLFIAINPLLISFLSAVLLKRKLTVAEIAGMLIASAGLVVATLPAFYDGRAKLGGVLLMIFSMIVYSIGGIYYVKAAPRLPNVVINMWQIFIGGILLLPLIFITGSYHVREYDLNFWGGLLWLVIPVSILANLLWFYLLKADAVKAANWMFLAPVFAYIWAFLFLKEPITVFSVAGTVIVITALYITRRNRA